MRRDDAVSLLRALQRQFAALGQLATAKALEQEEISFTHSRKLGEATGLHTAWRLVADLADRVQEGREPVARADAGDPTDATGDLVAQVYPPTRATGGGGQ